MAKSSTPYAVVADRANGDTPVLADILFQDRVTWDENDHIIRIERPVNEAPC